MGSLEGHLLPGTFILGFGIWWTYALFNRYFKLIGLSIRTKKHILFECTASYSPIEGFVKIITSIIGIIAEYVTALERVEEKGFQFTHIGNSQHISMYIFFLINGIFDLLIYYGLPVPTYSDYMTLTMAAVVEALLFCFHLHGRTKLDTHVHTLLIIAIFATIASVLIEWKYRNHMLSAFFRTLCALLQGSWFYTVGFILYPPFSRAPVQESDDKLMLLTALFCWQICLIVGFMCFVGFCFYCKYRPILNRREFSQISHSLHYSDIDFKTILNDSKPNEMNERNERELTRLKHSANQRNYTAVCTSDEDLK